MFKFKHRSGPVSGNELELVPEIILKDPIIRGKDVAWVNLGDLEEEEERDFP